MIRDIFLPYSPSLDVHFPLDIFPASRCPTTIASLGPSSLSSHAAFHFTDICRNNSLQSLFHVLFPFPALLTLLCPVLRLLSVLFFFVFLPVTFFFQILPSVNSFSSYTVLALFCPALRSLPGPCIPVRLPACTSETQIRCLREKACRV